MSSRLPEVLPTPERFAKGDLEAVRDERGNVVRASVRDNTVLADLIRRGVLDDLHGYYAKVYADMRKAFLAPVDSRCNPVYASEFFGSDGSGGVFATLYVRVGRKLRDADKRLVEYGFQPVPPGRPTVPRDAFRHAFDALIRQIDQARKDAREHPNGIDQRR